MPASVPPSAADILDRSFLENRARLLELAAFLDRLQRCGDGGTTCADHRLQALRAGIALLADDGPERVRRILAAFSDPTPTPRETAAGVPPVCGAWNGPC